MKEWLTRDIRTCDWKGNFKEKSEKDRCIDLNAI